LCSKRDTNYLNKKLDENLSQTHAIHSDNHELIINNELINNNENNNVDDINSHINDDDDALNRNFLNNFVIV